MYIVASTFTHFPHAPQACDLEHGVQLQAQAAHFTPDEVPYVRLRVEGGDGLTRIGAGLHVQV